MIEGRNFPGRYFDQPDKGFGFFATRWVQAEDAASAELAAVYAIRDEYRPQIGPPLDGEVAPTLHLSEIEEIGAFPIDFSKTGATWFPMDEEG